MAIQELGGRFEVPRIYNDPHFTGMIYRASGLEGKPGKSTILDWTSKPGEAGRAIRKFSGRQDGIVLLDRSETDDGVAEIPSCSLDVIVASFLVSSFPDDLQPVILKEAARMLKPGKRLVVADSMNFKVLLEETGYYVNSDIQVYNRIDAINGTFPVTILSAVDG